jgi:hypothetical protein
MKTVICAIEKDVKNTKLKRHSQGARQPSVARTQGDEEREISESARGLDLSAVTSLERNALQIALGVLRSDTDYGDFLNFWLQDYGRQVLSPNPPPPLLPELSAEEERMLALQDVPSYVH